MDFEFLPLVERELFIKFRASWKELNTILDTEKPDESKVSRWIKLFKETLLSGEEFLAKQSENDPKDQAISLARRVVDEMQKSLIGLDDVENAQNLKALFNFWFGLHYLYTIQMGEWGAKSKIEILEQQTIPAFIRAVQLVPGYIVAKELLTSTQEQLFQLRTFYGAHCSEQNTIYRDVHSK